MDAHLDESDDLQVGEELLPRRLKRMDYFQHAVGEESHLLLELGLESQMDCYQDVVAWAARYLLEEFRLPQPEQR